MDTMIVCRTMLPERLRETAAAAFLDAFGGCTTWPAAGRWRNDAGRTFVEPVDAWEVATNEPGRFERLAFAIGAEGGEEAVYVTVGVTAKILTTGLTAPAEANA